MIKLTKVFILKTHEKVVSPTQIEKLLSYIQPTRLRPSTKGVETLLEATESDKGRVINSPAFRRLQQKAQVFSFRSKCFCT